MKFDIAKTLFIIDGSSFLYRAYYGLKPLHTADGKPVHAVYSFCRMIKKLLDKYVPRYCVLVWDSKGKTTRHEIFPEYKATRQAPPSDLFEQREHIIEFAHLIGMHQVSQLGVEADDLMYSLAKEWIVDGDEEVVFVTLDKDMGQALTLGDKIALLDAFKEEFSDKEQLKEKMGFPVDKLPFYFALLGDASDNIPGVRGIGKKTAADLVNQFESLEQMYQTLDKIKKAGVKTALLEQKDNAYLSYELFLLRYDPINISKNELLLEADKWNNALPFFQELNFKSLLTQTGQAKQEQVQSVQTKIDYWKAKNFITITTREMLDVMIDQMKVAGAFALDTETDSLQPLESELIGLSLCADGKNSYYVPCGHTTGEVHLDKKTVVAALKPLFEDVHYKKYLHNAKYDRLVLYAQGIELAGIAFDTMLAAHLLVKEWQSVGLKKLSVHFFKEEMLTHSDMVKGSAYKDFSQVPLELATLYAAADSLQTYRLVEVLKDQLIQDQKLLDLYELIEAPLNSVLYDMEKKGVALEVNHLHEINSYVTKDIVAIEQEVTGIIGKEINLNSPSQVEQLLFYVLQLPPQKKSKTGKFSTDVEVLEALSSLHPVPKLIMTFRELSKLKSTYLEALPQYVNPTTKKVHTTFSQTGTATGRLSSSNPNVQNIPADTTGYGIEVRAAFVAEPGYSLISADYSQIELRVLAHVSQDANLIEAFLKGADIHAQTASRLFGIPFEQVSHNQRQVGKRINFSILYGLTPYGLSKDLDIPFKEAKKYIDAYFEQYPKVREWMNWVVEFTKKHGYIETLWGRKRFIPGIYEKNKGLYEEACRIAINTVAQGTAAEIMKLGMLACQKKLADQYPEASLLLQIHDEIIISAPDFMAQEVEVMVRATLEAVVQWNIPLEVATKRGCNWKEITV